MNRLLALGTADAFNAAGRGHSCYLLEDAAGLATVDFGPTALAALGRFGVEPGRIGAVHFTHLHGDHIGGWPFLLVDAVYRLKRTAPLAVSGPPGTRERLETLWAASYPDAAQRPLPFAVELVELLPGEARELAGRRVQALRAQHMRPPHVALSLAIEGPLGRLAFTGDTGPHPGLLELARGARLLVGECSDLCAPAEGTGEPRAGADYPREAGRRHMAWDDWRALLPALRGTGLRLAHTSAEVRQAAPALEAEARAAGHDVTFLEDGQALPLG